jgi:hypothetical protein
MSLMSSGAFPLLLAVAHGDNSTMSYTKPAPNGNSGASES